MCIFNEIGGLKSKLRFFFFACPVFLFLFCFGCCLFFFFLPVVIIKSFVSLLALIIQDWNKNVNVIYFRQHRFSCVVIKYIFKVNISLFFLQSFCIHLDSGSWFSLNVIFHFLFFLIDSRYQSNSAFVF